MQLALASLSPQALGWQIFVRPCLTALLSPACADCTTYPPAANDCPRVRARCPFLRRSDARHRVKQFALEAVAYLQTPLGATADIARGLIVARLQAVLSARSALP